MTTKKTPIKTIKNDNVEEKIKSTLKKAREEGDAYTIAGLMIDAFGVKERDIHNKSFSDWPKGLPTMYTRIRVTLEKLVNEDRVIKEKYGKAYHYWWK